MQQLIIGYLFEHGQCSIPGIGKFQIQHNPAKYDITKKEINPPYQTIIFEEIPVVKISNLVEAISFKMSVTKDVARDLLEKYSMGIKNKLDQNEIVELETVGKMYKVDKNLQFESANTLNFVQPITAEKIHHDHPVHQVLVGENLVNTSAKHDKETPPSISRFIKYFWIWWIITIAVISIAIGIYHFYGNPFNVNSVGNSTKIHPAPPLKTHE